MAISTPSRRTGAMSPDADRAARMRKLIKTLRAPGMEEEDMSVAEEEDAPVKPRRRLARDEIKADEGAATGDELVPEVAVPMGAKPPVRKPRFMAASLPIPDADGPGGEQMPLIDGDAPGGSLEADAEEVPPPRRRKATKRRGLRGGPPVRDTVDEPVFINGPA